MQRAGRQKKPRPTPAGQKPGLPASGGGSGPVVLEEPAGQPLAGAAAAGPDGERGQLAENLADLF